MDTLTAVNHHTCKNVDMISHGYQTCSFFVCGYITVKSNQKCNHIPGFCVERVIPELLLRDGSVGLDFSLRWQEIAYNIQSLMMFLSKVRYLIFFLKVTGAVILTF